MRAFYTDLAVANVASVSEVSMQTTQVLKQVAEEAISACTSVKAKRFFLLCLLF